MFIIHSWGRSQDDSHFSHEETEVQRNDVINIKLHSQHKILQPSFLGVFLFVFFFASRHAGGEFPNQGLNLCPWQWKHGDNCWSTREVLPTQFYLTPVEVKAFCLDSAPSFLHHPCLPITLVPQLEQEPQRGEGQSEGYL